MVTAALSSLHAQDAGQVLATEHEGDEVVADAHGAGGDSKLPFDTKEIIFEHLGDAYGWEVPFDHHHRIPLPCILYSPEIGLHIFSSSRVTSGQTYVNNGVEFKIAGHDSKYKNKIVAIVNGEELRPWDLSITKNICAIFISVLLVIWMVMSVANWYKKGNVKAPRRLRGGIEVIITFIYDSVIKPTLGKEAMRFAPYLLSVFMFILVMNIMGLIVVFPGGANLTGNIAVTLVLALITFFITNLFGTKHYWKEIFWPDVPMWLKFPIPIMQVIEVFGIFTKPAALTVRLFANMMGGHMIVIVLTLLIFIFSAIAMSPAVGGGTAVVSIIFSVFMLLIDVLVSFIQAYVFTMLSTVFIGLAREGHDHDEHARDGKEAHAAIEA
ncbi:MAG: F0F1 ATP synthase subunit A [Muribaculaceae bacterium]|nr:F0F1 ATP synthase subunit A [Muribaculaceae bacterium]